MNSPVDYKTNHSEETSNQELRQIAHNEYEVYNCIGEKAFEASFVYSLSIHDITSLFSSNTVFSVNEKSYNNEGIAKICRGTLFLNRLGRHNPKTAHHTFPINRLVNGCNMPNMLYQRRILSR